MQPTNDELEQLLADAQAQGEIILGSPRLAGRNTWKRRVFALYDAFNLRKQWLEPADKELRIKIRRYLHTTGLPV